ncbi:uncharacterized protein L201_007198 [Kwoniella dendrophila CBS 6074]|uniref:Bromo domain-containing protein n=1 Tax=Kwoniella dendrophila CBS 6074 TaxID=1295534 RepID=A0AAX4K519_9TREE
MSGNTTRSSRRDATGIAPEKIASASSSPNIINASQSESSTDPNVQQQQSSVQKIKIKRLGVDPTLIISDDKRSKRKRTQSQEPEHQLNQNQQNQQHVVDDKDPKDPVKAKELGYVIYRKIMDNKSSDGDEMAHPFIKLPNKRALPDYYETIKHPLSLEMVQQKLDASEYQTLKDVCADLGQIFNNAKRYNVKESLIFQYAKKLHKMTRTYYTNITSPELKEESDSEGEHEVNETTAQGASMQPTILGDGYDDDVDAEGEIDPEGDVEMAEPEQVEPESNEPISTATAGSSVVEKEKRVRRRGAYMKDGPSVYKMIKPCLKSIKEARAKDGSGREIAGIFTKLPPRRDLPDYYATIKNPISLEEIESKQIGRRYDTFQEFADDIELMCRNAMEYNEDGSEVYMDAQQIMGILAWNQNVTRPSNLVPQPSITPIASRHAQGHKRQLPQSIGYSPSQIAYSQSPVNNTIPLPTPIPQSGPSPSLSPYPAGSSRHPQPVPSPTPIPVTQGHRPFLPALPPGVVTEEVVASLDRYPPYERQAWTQTLPPLAVNMYRSMLATNEARKRSIHQPPPGPQYPHAQPLSGHPQPSMHTQSPHPSQSPHQPVSQPMAQRHNSSSSSRPELQTRTSHGQPPLPALPVQQQQQNQPQSSQPPVKAEKPRLPIPTVNYLDFTFHSRTHRAPTEELRQTIRLKNLRGLHTHSILLNSTISEIDLIAYINDEDPNSTSSEKKDQLDGGSEDAKENGTIIPVTTPELSLRINGNQGSLPRFIYDQSSSTINGSAKQGEKPKGMKWNNIHISTSKIESKIEIVSTKPGSLAETTTIFLNRQF